MAVDEFDLDIRLGTVEQPIEVEDAKLFSYGRCRTDGTVPHTCSC